jgi:serine/threonine protein kinase
MIYATLPVHHPMLSPGSGTAITKRCALCGRIYHYNERHSCTAAPASDPLVGERQPSDPEVGGESDPILGAILGDRYLMLSRLSRGGMGVVYKARHVLLDTPVAVKILIEPQDPVAQMRFLQEAKLASQIRHPNTVYISDFGILDDGRSYLVMELLRGPTLGRVMRDGPMEPPRACKIAAQIAIGLQAVHDRGIVHRGLMRSTEKLAKNFPDRLRPSLLLGKPRAVPSGKANSQPSQ